MSKASREKGKRGEVEAGHALSDLLGQSVERELGQERDGGCDIKVKSSAGTIALQVKRQERSKINPWLRQARDDAQMGELPAVMWRSNGKGWCVVMDLEEWCKLVREAQ